MRLSLWQQFSSNHSGFFWVVGTFQTLEAARHAYDELRAMLQAIDRWHQEHAAESTAALYAGNINPLPPEVEFAARFQIEWPMTIDWGGWGGYAAKHHPSYDPHRAAQYNIDKAVWIAGRIVEVSNPDQTWMTVQPFLGLLEHFGADAFGYDLESVESGEFQDPHSKFMFSFHAPDEATAAHLETAIRTYLEKLPVISDVNPPPWKNDFENFQQAFAGKTSLNKQAVESALSRWQSMFDSMSKWSNRDSVPAYIEMSPKRLAIRRCESFRRDGLDFEFENLAFENEPLGIYALIAYLEVNGCTDIDIRYEREAQS